MHHVAGGGDGGYGDEHARQPRGSIRHEGQDTGSPGEYDHSVVLISGDAFLLRSDYSYLSTETQINYGKMNTLSIETVKYSRIDSLEVSVC